MVRIINYILLLFISSVYYGCDGSGRGRGINLQLRRGVQLQYTVLDLCNLRINRDFMVTVYPESRCNRYVISSRETLDGIRIVEGSNVIYELGEQLQGVLVQAYEHENEVVLLMITTALITGRNSYFYRKVDGRWAEIGHRLYKSLSFTYTYMRDVDINKPSPDIYRFETNTNCGNKKVTFTPINIVRIIKVKDGDDIIWVGCIRCHSCRYLIAHSRRDRYMFVYLIIDTPTGYIYRYYKKNILDQWERIDEYDYKISVNRLEFEYSIDINDNKSNMYYSVDNIPLGGLNSYTYHHMGDYIITGIVDDNYIIWQNDVLNYDCVIFMAVHFYINIPILCQIYLESDDPDIQGNRYYMRNNNKTWSKISKESYDRRLDLYDEQIINSIEPDLSEHINEEELYNTKNSIINQSD